jgi:TetR/AcrR family transcriptional regulator, transcriptional repressor for nem operon
MRQSREAKAESNRAIVAEASRLFRERGVEGASVADVMQAAQMTHGGFYKHFGSKDDLLAASLTAAFDGFVEGIASHTGSGAEAIDAFVAMYLSKDHLENPGLGCPIATLGIEMSRLNGAAAQAMADGIARVTDALAARMPGPKSTAYERAQFLLSALAGALLVARAAGSTKAGMAVIETCRARLRA